MKKFIITSILLIVLLLSTGYAVQAYPIGGCCLDYDGIDDEVAVTYRLDSTTDWSVDLWLYCDSGHGVAGEIWSQDSLSYLLYWRWASALNLWWGADVLTFDDIVMDEWNNVVVTRDGNDFVAYTNGVEDDTGSTANTRPVNELYFGSAIGVTFTKMKQGSTIIYDRALTAFEVAYNWNSGAGRESPYSETGIIIWWKVDEGTGVTLNDSSIGGTYDGMITSATWLSLIADAPTNLVVNRGGGNLVYASWTKAVGAEDTVVVAKSEDYPVSPADGYLLYDDTGEGFQTNVAELDWNEVYISAWSETDAGYSDESANTVLGGVGLIDIITIWSVIGVCIAGIMANFFVRHWVLDGLVFFVGVFGILSLPLSSGFEYEFLQYGLILVVGVEFLVGMSRIFGVRR